MITGITLSVTDYDPVSVFLRVVNEALAYDVDVDSVSASGAIYGTFLAPTGRRVKFTLANVLPTR